jgi:hypothetical protein
VLEDDSESGAEQAVQGKDTLDGESVLPGFLLPLRELFAELDRHG